MDGAGCGSGRGSAAVSGPVSGPVVETEEGYLVERVAGLDIGKEVVTGCVRTPAAGGRRRREVREFATTTAGLLGLSGWLREERVELTGMEATSSYWKPVFYLLEAEGVACELYNPRHVKHLPGRPKTDVLDAMWLARVVEKGLARPSLVHPKPMRQLRDLTRYRRSLVREQTREKQRLEKLLEDAQIKLSSVISDIFGVSGRQMLEAMIAGQRDPRELAQMAHGSMRSKIARLEEALTGHFEDHHAFLARQMLDRIDRLDRDTAVLDARIEEAIEPFQGQLTRLDAIPGIGVRAAQELIAEIGVDMGRFPTPGHLVSWAKFAPIVEQSATRSKSASTGRGNSWLAGTLGEVVAAAARTDTFLGERYRRLARRRGKRRAIVAVGNSILKIVWSLLSDPDAVYRELGPDYYQSHIQRGRRERRERDLIRQLQALTGKRVVLQHAA